MKISINKILAITFIASLFVILGNNTLKACEIEFEVVKGKKEVYEKGDEVIINVKVMLTHRICPESLNKTKFDSDGIKILGATSWKETSPGIWERKLKTRVEGNEKGELTLSATRTCHKEGGFGSITLKYKNN